MADSRAIAFVAGLIIGFMLAVYLGSHGYIEFGGTTTTTVTTTPQPSGCTISTLLDRDYYRTLLGILGNAKKSIYVVMYVVKYDPREPNDPVNMLLETLVNMSNRGLDVKIVVDDETYTSYPETIEFIKNSGISLKLDEYKSRTTHAKIVIVDNETAVLGSHNWTESALTNNHEASIVTDCPSVVENLLSYFSNIWTDLLPALKGEGSPLGGSLVWGYIRFVHPRAGSPAHYPYPLSGTRGYGWPSLIIGP